MDITDIIEIPELLALQEMVAHLAAACTDADLLDLICKLLVTG